ncbi:MAG: acetolactate synthase small subunit [Citrobacter freundii]|nr:acetolactate synthase small subunit [Citrobacter freundii]
MRRILSVLLENESGALSRVIGLFAQRGYNIESLTVAPTDDPTLSRMTIQTVGDEKVLEQIEIFRGQIIDVTPSIYTVQLAGTSDKLDAFLATLREVAKIVEVARSGVVGLSRGDKIMR